MKNLKDDRTTILPSTTRGGKGLPSSLALDSPSVMSKFATPNLLLLPLLPYYFATKYFAADTKLSRCG